MKTFLAACRFQLVFSSRQPDTVHVLATSPLFTLVLLSIAAHSQRPDFAVSAVLAPVFMSLWTLALFTAGDIISEDRSRGVLEAIVATPARFVTVVLGRLCTVTLLSLVSVGESWLVARLFFGISLGVVHPVVFVMCLVVSALAMAGTASILSALFVLMPSARIVQNTLSYPIYLLGGLLVPVAQLPEWVRPLSHLIFLSWSADLLRSSVSGSINGWGAAVATIAALGLAAAGVGAVLIGRILRRVRRTGMLAHA